MACRKQLSLLDAEQPEQETKPLFADWPYCLPDEEAYNARRKAEGLFKITEEEKEAWKKYQEERRSQNGCGPGNPG